MLCKLDFPKKVMKQKRNIFSLEFDGLALSACSNSSCSLGGIIASSSPNCLEKENEGKYGVKAIVGLEGMLWLRCRCYCQKY